MGKTRGKIRNRGRKMTRRRSKRGGMDKVEEATVKYFLELSEEEDKKRQMAADAELARKAQEEADAELARELAQGARSLTDTVDDNLTFGMEKLSLEEQRAIEEAMKDSLADATPEDWNSEDLRNFHLVQVPGDGDCGFYAVLGGLGMLELATVGNGENEVNCTTLRRDAGIILPAGARKSDYNTYGLDISTHLYNLAKKYKVCFKIYNKSITGQWIWISTPISGAADYVGAPDKETPGCHKDASPKWPIIYLYNPVGVHYELLIPNDEWTIDNKMKLWESFSKLDLDFEVAENRSGREGGTVSKYPPEGGRRRTRKNRRKVRRKRGKKTKKR